MKFLRSIIPLMVVILALGACSGGARVIPVRKMEKIYREMFLADQWLAENPDKRVAADTSWFYEPIFEKYGFTSDDYRKSVDHYLNDPKRYAEMLSRVVKSLNTEAGALNRKLALQDKSRSYADSVAKARRRPVELHSPLDVLEGGTLCWINFKLDSNGVYYLAPAAGDTTFVGPEIVVEEEPAKDSTADGGSLATVLPAAGPKYGLPADGPAFALDSVAVRPLEKVRKPDAGDKFFME